MKILSEHTLATEELEDFSVMTVTSHENNFWKDKDGKLHREDGPAVEYPNGYKAWFQHGKRHREDGPAIEWANSDKAWYLNGKDVSEADVRALGKIK